VRRYDAGGSHAACRGVGEGPELTFPSGKAPGIAGQGPGRPGRVLERHRYGPAPGGGFEFRAGLAGQLKRIGEQPGRFLAGGETNAALEVAHRSRADPGCLGQLFLRQACAGPQLTQ